MIFIYYKVIYFCSLNIYLDSHKVKMIMLQCCYSAVAGWQCCYYVVCSLLSHDYWVISHSLSKLLAKRKILFYSVLSFLFWHLPKANILSFLFLQAKLIFIVVLLVGDLSQLLSFHIPICYF